MEFLILVVIIVFLFVALGSMQTVDIKAFCHTHKQPHKWQYDTDDYMVCTACKYKPSKE